MNKRWSKRRAPAEDEQQVIRCSADQIPLVLAKLRRQGWRASEPVREPDLRTCAVLPDGRVKVEGSPVPRQWLIRAWPNGEDPAMELTSEDGLFHFNRFSQGMRGQLWY